MGTMKKIFDVLELIKVDPGIQLIDISVEMDILPVEVKDWLEMLRLDKMVEPRHANDGNGTEGWYILEAGEQAIAWIHAEDPTEEA